MLHFTTFHNVFVKYAQKLVMLFSIIYIFNVFFLGRYYHFGFLGRILLTEYFVTEISEFSEILLGN